MQDQGFGLKVIARRRLVRTAPVARTIARAVLVDNTAVVVQKLEIVAAAIVWPSDSIIGTSDMCAQYRADHCTDEKHHESMTDDPSNEERLGERADCKPIKAMVTG